jgi:hypothetical protein
MERKMQRRLVAHEVAQKLNAVERQIDQTLVAAGALLSALPDARERAHLSAVVGQDALAQVAQATVILSEARGKMVEAHHALAETGRQIGVGKIVAELGDKTVPTGQVETRVTVPHIRAA